MEHHSNLVPWQQLAERTGAVLRHVPITDDGLLVLDELDALLSDRTKIVAVASVSNVLGTVNPVTEIARRAHAAGALVLVDAAPERAAPCRPTSWRWGPTSWRSAVTRCLGRAASACCGGVAELLEAMPPFLGGGSMINRVYADHFTPAEPPAKFEAGTPPIAPAIALGAAIDYLNAIGLDAVERHERELVRYAYERLRLVAGRANSRPPAGRAGQPGELHAQPAPCHDVAQILDEHGIAVRAGHHCTQPLHDRLGAAPAPAPASISTTSRPRSTPWSRRWPTSNAASAPGAGNATAGRTKRRRYTPPAPGSVGGSNRELAPLSRCGTSVPRQSRG